MIVGVAVWELHLNGCRSLKDKRRILKSLKDRLHQRFNVSVAETSHQDRWQRAEVACCVVSSERRHAESVLSAVNNMVQQHPDARILDSSTHFV